MTGRCCSAWKLTHVFHHATISFLNPHRSVGQWWLIKRYGRCHLKACEFKHLHIHASRPMKPVRCEAVKACCEDGCSPETAVLQLQTPLMSLMISWQLAALSSTFHTWLPSRGLQKKSHFKEFISFIAVAQWKRLLLQYSVRFGPFVQLPNQTQLARRCGTRTLLEVASSRHSDFC